MIDVKATKAKIRALRDEIKDLEKQIKESGYDEPMECLECGWKGVESRLVEGKYSTDYHIESGIVCPACGSPAVERTER